MINNNTKFRPAYGTEARILATDFHEGWVYVASDTGKIFLDSDGRRQQIGGSSGSGSGGSSSIVWGYADEELGNIIKATEDASDGDPVYYFNVSAVETGTIPDVDALILNSDGRFFRVTDNATSAEGFFTVELIAVSGGGQGGGGGTSTPDLSLTWNENINLLGSTYIYGQDNEIIFYPHSDTDEVVNIIVTAIDKTGNYPDVVRQDRILNDAAFRFNANLLPESNNIEIQVTIQADHSTYNKGRGLTKTFVNNKVLKMYLEKPSDIMIGIQTGAASLPYLPHFTNLGTTENPVRIRYAIDGSDPVDNGTPLVAANNEHKQYINIPRQEHGMHVVELWLSVVINAIEYHSSRVSYEVPWVDTQNDTPIIWTRNELGTIVNYEPAVIEYMVYSSVAARQGSFIEVSLYHGNDLLNTEEVEYDSAKWLTMDLTANYEVGNNIFTLSVGTTSKEISFYVTNDGARDLSLRHSDQLEVNFDSLGRSSKEIKSSRGVWVSKCSPTVTAHEGPYEAILENFNWYSNGWKNDNDGMGSYLSVSNGASVRIPMSSITFNGPAQPWSFEIRFRIRNAKKFATLVTEIPKYRYILDGVENPLGEELTLEEIEALNVDGHVAEPMLDEDGNKVMNEANTTKKIVQTNKYIAFKYLNNNGEGFAIGTQEAYFNTQGQTVNVKYKEGEIINISFVVDRSSDALSIYLNGILSGVATLNRVPLFTMQNIPFIINSEYCDFDLYKIRVYPIALTLPDVIHNYIADIKDISLYDENQLTDINDDTLLSYQALVAYNTAHPDDPTMPYCVIDSSGLTPTDLPCYKGDKKKVRIEFTNPVADYKLANGDITPFEYYTHCPSFVADDVELNVQGTSSQKYPRRNFKAKFKKAKNWKYTQGELANQIINPDKDKTGISSYSLSDGHTLSLNWHEDHETIGSNAFTWKIDYMESSGSYNTGFANLLGSGIYDKHPLQDIFQQGSGVDASEFRTTVYGFPFLVFNKTGENSYTYIGRYNFNLDKSSNERYGFELKKPQPYVTWNREVEIVDGNGDPVLDPITNEPTTQTESYHPNVKDVAECWELRDNQGLWCSFRYPTDEMRQDHFWALMEGSTMADPKIEVVQHFEARYHPQADEFEYAQNILLNKPNTDDLSQAIGGTSNSAASTFCYNKLKNLEKLFDWLDSTDTQNATNEPFDTPITLEVNAKLLDPEEIAAAAVVYSERQVGDALKQFGTFSADTIEYRRQKFYAEFDKHLDQDYCAVYFVMTELLLCYDSRGKNMMIATWGPREQGGEYIWYPIFYDIDTQLGLNNVGAKLWDYNEDCSENGTFSTKNSVLWVNFYDLFKNKVLSTYRSLRNGKVNYNTIESSYMCKAGTTYNSYAMQGKRPIVAIGLDEYYKYVLPTKEPWKNQEEKWVTANYLYACQGDRILSRELLINNRLLYMDSKWLGGSFTISTGGMSGLMFRSTGNKWSDKYIDNPIHGENQVEATYPVPYLDAIPEYYVTPYLDFYVTTFVDENVFQTAEAYREDKYPNGIPTVISPSVAVGYKSGSPDQQLNYFAGSEYISSLGDLSLKYINQADIVNTPRLLDITLGNDHPKYFNNEGLNPFNLHTEVNIDGNVKPGDEKSLLEKIILTNVKGVNMELDVRSPDKLKEFRALGTNLKYVLFADGAPLKIVHLPNTVTRIIFNQNKDLTKVLHETPVVVDMLYPNGTSTPTDPNDPLEIGTMTYRDPATYEGLFIDGVTNYQAGWVEGDNDTKITEISFDGDALGYGSYEILHNVVMRKYGTPKDNRLKIRMADVSWTPYVQVEYGEAKIAGTQYYYLTDHSTYEQYNHPDSEWYTDTLNGKVYTYDNTKDESTITDLSLLEIFYNDYTSTAANDINQFVNNIAALSTERSYPTISGELYVSNANGTAIAESDLTNKYAVCWPNLKIRAAKVDKAYIAKYVQRIANKDNELDIIRYAKDEINPVHPTVTAKVPVLANHDFMGWTLDPAYVLVDKNQVADLKTRGKILEDNNITALTFSAENDIYIFYAVFAITSFAANFYDADGTTLIYSTRVDYGQYIGEPPILPATDESALEEDQRYRFLGWKMEATDLFPRSEALATGIVNLNQIKSQTMDKNFYACYILENVHARATDSKYFDFVSATTTSPLNFPYSNLMAETSGYKVRPKDGYTLYGKITIPASYNNQPIVSIEGFHGSAFVDGLTPQEHITHIFFMGPCYEFAANAFRTVPNTLKYVECPDGLQLIGDSAFLSAGVETFVPKPGLKVVVQYAFSETPYLNYFELPEGVVTVGGSAFNTAFKSATISLYKIPGSLAEIYNYSFGFMHVVTSEIQFGDINHPSQTYSQFILSGIENSIAQSNVPLSITYYSPVTLDAENKLTIENSLRRCAGEFTIINTITVNNPQ